MTAVYLNTSTASSYNVKQLSADTTQYDDTIMRGANYTISVLGENIIGNGTINSIMICKKIKLTICFILHYYCIVVDYNEELSIPLSCTSTIRVSATVTMTTTVSPTSCSNNNSLGIIIISDSMHNQL